MLKLISLGLFSLLAFNSPVSEATVEEVFCYQTCTESVQVGTAVHVISVTAGGPFTSCAAAQRRACRRLARAIEGMQQEN